MKADRVTTGLSAAVVMPASNFTRARGGRDLDPPLVINRTVAVRMTDDLADDRHISLTTTFNARPLYRVAVVDGFNRPTEPPRTYTDLNAARRQANRLYKRLTTKET